MSKEEFDLFDSKELYSRLNKEEELLYKDLFDDEDWWITKVPPYEDELFREELFL